MKDRGDLGAMTGLERLLRPASIAVVGGGAWGEAVVTSARASGFAGPIWPVHPHRAEVAGEQAFPNLAALPGVPDAAFVAVNHDKTLDALEALAAMGTGGAIAFASGFAEHGAEGQARQAALASRAGDMPVLGPNCYGLINALDGVALWPDRHGLARVETGVAIVSQSGNMLLNLTMQSRGLPIAFAVAAGNQAQTGVAEIGAALLADGRVTALGLHIEGIGDLRAFEALAAQADELSKPIVALKVGRSAGAQAAGVSHTAALAGSAAGAAALLDRLGIARVESLGALLQALELCHAGVVPAAPKLAVMSCSGGEAGLAADAAEARGLDCPDLTEAQRGALSDVLGARVALANPLDYHTYIWGDTAKLTAMIGSMLQGEAALGAVLLDFPRDDLGPSPAWDSVVAAGGAARADSDTPLAILATLPDLMPPGRSEQVRAAGLVPLSGLEDAFDAIAALARRQAPDRTPILRPMAVGEGTVVLEHEAKAALAEFGVDVPRGRHAADATAAGKAAVELGGAVVLKGLGAAHKSESGWVALGLSGAADVTERAAAMAAADFLVEEMVGDAIAELLIGVVADPAYGFVLTLGSGGVMAELFDDTASLILPAAPASIEAALDGLKIAPVLSGYRGKQGADRGAVLAAIAAVQAFVAAHAERLLEVEINPLISTPARAVAADALIIWGEGDD